MERLDYLFELVVGGNATEEEHAELLQLMQAPENEAKARELLRQSFISPDRPVHLPLTTSASMIEAIINVNKEPRLPLHWRRITAAAAILLLAAAGVYFFALPKNSASIALQPKARLPLPGGDKAILTLANGDKIILDSAANGTIAAQGNASVVKLASGQLAYQTAKGKEATPVYNIMETPRGGGYRLSLPDGSKVWLNSASSIKFPTTFTGSQRRVDITGEAYFEVAANNKAPFIVETRGLQVQVLGTEFNLMAYTDEDAIKTTLVSGAVRVLKGTEKSLLRPGQQALLSKGASAFQTNPANLEEVLAWKEGKFRFTKSDIKVIMRQIARWYDVDIVYKGNLPDIEFSGVFPRKQYVSELLEVLEDAVKVHFDTNGNTITVTPKLHNMEK